MSALDSHLAKKAATDAGWEMPIQMEGYWLGCTSSRFDPAAWLRPDEANGYLACFNSTRLSRILAREAETTTVDDAPVNPCFAADNNSALYSMMRRAAKIARSLPDQPCQEFTRKTKHLPKTTEAERLVVQRVGQEIFRDSLLDYWDSRCAVTGLAEPALLRASHAKPWAKCDDDEERLDVFNGLLLAPHLDALFDDGWIGFADDGVILCSGQFTEPLAQTLHIDSSMRLSRVEQEHQTYLAYHRSHVMRH